MKKSFFSVGLEMLVDAPNDGCQIDENVCIAEQQKQIDELIRVVKVLCYFVQRDLDKGSP